VTGMTVDSLEDRLRAPGGAVRLVPYVMAGHPDRNTSLATIRHLMQLDIGVLEIGIPYSDPLADGPIIQRAGQRALESGATVGSTLELAAEVGNETDVPLVLMTYVNPVLAYGVSRFAEDARAAGVAGVIVADLPADESEEVTVELTEVGLDTVFLVAPTSSERRVRAICERSTGFVYCVTLTGTTGTRSTLPPGLPELLGRVRKHTALPVAAGFGISTPEHVNALKGHADAVVVGSAIVGEMDAGRDPIAVVQRLVAACR
jgi:tryptophan synthase alpha chain